MPNLGQIWGFLEPCDLEIWQMTLKNNRAPLLSNIKLYASFHHHMWIQTGVTVRKRLSWVVTSVILTFDLWPWPFAWTLRWSLVITPENFMMIRWWEHSQKGVTDRRTDGGTDGQRENTICRAAWSQLKIARKGLTKCKPCAQLSEGSVICHKHWIRSEALWCILSIKTVPDSKVHGAYMGPTGPRWAPCWPHEPCY